MNITALLVQTGSYVTEIAKEKHIEILIKIVLNSSNKKYLPSCQVYINEPTMA